MNKDLNNKVFDSYNEKSCYWAGFLAADGCIDVNGTIRIELAGVDKQHVYDFREFCESVHSISYNAAKNSYKVGFCSPSIKEALYYNFSLTVDKTYNLMFPLFSEEWQYKAYLRGFFDGDGCFTEFFNNRPMASFRVFLSSSTLNFLENILLYLRSINVIVGGSIQKQGKKDAWNIQLGVRDATAFLNWIYSIDGPKLERKYNKYVHIIVNGNRMRRE